MGGHAVMRVRGHDENEDELEKNGKAYHCKENGELTRLKGALKELFDGQPHLLQGWKRRAVVPFPKQAGDQEKGNMQKDIEIAAF